MVPLNVGTDQHYWTEGAEAIDGRSAPSAHGNNVVRTLIPVLDSFIGGLRPNHLTLIDSADRLMFDLTHMLCVNGVGVLNSDVVWIDGGNSVDPYEIGRVCRRFGRDRDEVLDSVRVARAFTAYQLVSLIDERLEDELGAPAPEWWCCRASQTCSWTRSCGGPSRTRSCGSASKRHWPSPGGRGW